MVRLQFGNSRLGARTLRDGFLVVTYGRTILQDLGPKLTLQLSLSKYKTKQSFNSVRQKWEISWVQLSFKPGAFDLLVQILGTQVLIFHLEHTISSVNASPLVFCVWSWVNRCHHPPAISTVFPIKSILHSISMRSILNISNKKKLTTILSSHALPKNMAALVQKWGLKVAHFRKTGRF